MAADSPAMGAAASLRILLSTPAGLPSVVTVASVVVVVVVGRAVVRKGKITGFFDIVVVFFSIF